MWFSGSRDLSCWVFKWIYLWPTLYRSVCPFPVCEFFKPKCFLQLVISKLQLKHKVTFFNTKYEPNTHWLSQHLYFLLYRVCMLKISKIVRFCEWERLQHKTLGDKEWDDLTPLSWWAAPWSSCCRTTSCSQTPCDAWSCWRSSARKYRSETCYAAYQCPLGVHHCLQKPGLRVAVCALWSWT